MIADLGAAEFSFLLDKSKIIEDDVDIETNQWWYYVLHKVTNEGSASHIVMAH